MAIRCMGCGSEWPEGQRFCGNCGTPLLATCRACGTRITAPDQRFCGGCGAPLQTGSDDAPAGRLPSSELPSERRLLSVLFADLAGFTPFSETRDAEDVREVLEQYFVVCSSAIEHHGGTVQ
jgi:NADH pyrophosphatase NudC (nudix superfamily)